MEPVRNDEERREVAKEGDARGEEAREPRRRGGGRDGNEWKTGGNCRQRRRPIAGSLNNLFPNVDYQFVIHTSRADVKGENKMPEKRGTTSTTPIKKDDGRRAQQLEKKRRWCLRIED